MDSERHEPAPPPKYGQFTNIISVGFNKYGEPDFRVCLAVANLDRAQINDLCQTISWATKEALDLWMQLGPPSRDEGLKQCAAEPKP